MRAFRLVAYETEPELVQMSLPDPGPGEVTIEVAACGLNFADLLMMRGKYQERPDPPVTLGMEMAGTVSALGPQVRGLAPGDRVAVFTGQGGLAEAANVPADRCVRLPEGMPFSHAAAFQVAYGTSHVALAHRARLGAGERLVVTGAAGGVGLTAVEIGALMGAEVVAIARGEAKLDIARAAGARHLIDAESSDMRGQLKALGGADVVYETVGGALWEACFRAARPEARLLAIGFASGEVPQIPANHLLVKNLSVIGLYWGGYLAFRPEILTGSLAQLFAWYAEGRLSPHVGRELPLERAGEALEMLRQRKSTGKLVVTMR
ncbi:NADPH:quinone oxidoreductase family protein [Tropicimonas sp. IMCC6043]|uniref:NADPH:quinone oxidoreductase family protein n=1 Tax=Tropicimonas sp. IMCC6043 TaxID=2510645 RepID=UPI00101BB32D|nr:NADPH:quinone oxidoreductase family protein [Tropicimonas sp. IMCC6043]RYH11834.1 NADPH:quinone oxidoreductase family protein [Tropicimonas sp. IMCC6043]